MPFGCCCCSGSFRKGFDANNTFSKFFAMRQVFWRVVHNFRVKLETTRPTVFSIRLSQNTICSKESDLWKIGIRFCNSNSVQLRRVLSTLSEEKHCLRKLDNLGLSDGAGVHPHLTRGVGKVFENIQDGIGSWSLGKFFVTQVRAFWNLRMHIFLLDWEGTESFCTLWDQSQLGLLIGSQPYQLDHSHWLIFGY